MMQDRQSSASQKARVGRTAGRERELCVRSGPPRLWATRDGGGRICFSAVTAPETSRPLLPREFTTTR